jgi:asparagine synthase (glutamine-hydrolysing)
VIHISLQYNQYRNYTQAFNCVVTGEAFYQGNLTKDGNLLQLIDSLELEEHFIDILNHLNGYYALIKHNDQQLFAAVDRVRSIPIFYGQKGPDFFLSDSAEWVRQQVGDAEMGPLAREEFLLTGYVTGPDTLFPGVKQLQAGEALIVQDDRKSLSIKTIRYYCFIHEYETYKSMENLMEEHDHILFRIFNRLIQLADGRTIVVPLSGGHDSRLIVLMLKRLKYDNVITFSYGRPGNKESDVSRTVAESLSLRWEFVPYSNEDWYRWFNSEERKSYWRFSSGLSSIPHNQDWPAVWYLKNERLIPDDSIFVPGHSADLPAGSRSSSVPQVYKNNPINQAHAINSILRYHFSLRDWSKRSKELSPIFEKRILMSLGSLNKYPDNASAFESWDIAERQAKFIINALRVYEFWNYQWWLPFWDHEYMQFWSTVPLEFRINQVMYKLFVDNLFYTLTGFTLPKDELNLTYKQRLINLLAPYINQSLKRKLSQIMNHVTTRNIIDEYKNNPLAWWGRYAKSEQDFLALIKRIHNLHVDALNSMLYIQEWHK